MDLKYFLIPSSQRHKSSSTAIKTILDAPNGKNLVFMRAISVVLTIPYQQEHLVRVNDIACSSIICTSGYQSSRT